MQEAWPGSRSVFLVGVPGVVVLSAYHPSQADHPEEDEKDQGEPPVEVPASELLLEAGGCFAHGGVADC